MIYRIILCFCFIASIFSAETVFLKTTNISKENITGTNVGIRPFRKTGIRIEAEHIGDKLLIHNYGYGGSGLTLSFGGVLEVMNILESHETTPRAVAILGAGVVGLTTAYDLLAKGYEVLIYADEWSPNLTSNIAAGIWSPLSFPDNLSEEKRQLHARMQKNAEIRFLQSIGDSPEFAGVRILPVYSFKTGGSSDIDGQKEEIIVHFDNGVIKKGTRTYEIGLDGQVFMNDLYDKVQKKGAVLKKCHFASLEDVRNLEEPIIINCTSMGSIELFHDREFIPVRGQLVYFTAQKDIDYLYYHKIGYSPDDANRFFVSVYPWDDRIILGGVYEQNQEEPVIQQSIIDRIIENAEEYLSGRL